MLVRTWWGLAVVAAVACGSATGTDASSELAGDSQAAVGGASEPGAPLEAWCERWLACGGTWYATPAECVDATLDYWGSCDSMVRALDGFAECMVGVPCDEYDPDTLDPEASPCADPWEAVLAADCPSTGAR